MATPSPRVLYSIAMCASVKVCVCVEHYITSADAYEELDQLLM